MTRLSIFVFNAKIEEICFSPLIFYQEIGIAALIGKRLRPHNVEKNSRMSVYGRQRM